MKRILIDCDPGIDDAVALIAAVKSEDLEVEAITATTGNLRADHCAANVLKVLDLLDAPPIPVACGPLQPLVRPHAVDPLSHGSDGLGGRGLPPSERKLDSRFAADLIIDTVDQHGDLIIVATAPLTNLALAIIKRPDIAEKVGHVYFIGGNYGFNEYSQLYGTGTTPLSEWNVLVDPEAARVVFRSGVPITAMGVDVWTQPGMNLDDAEIEALARSDRPEARLVSHFEEFVEHRGYLRYCALIDALATIAALDPSIIRTHRVGVDVETSSPLTLGMTVVERRVYHGRTDLPHIDAAYDVDFACFKRTLLELIHR